MPKARFIPEKLSIATTICAVLTPLGGLHCTLAHAASQNGTTPPAPVTDASANADWMRRAHASGVVIAVGFDSIEEWAKYSYERENCNPDYQVRTGLLAKAGCRSNAWDNKVRASGNGSVRFDILPGSWQGGGGSMAIPFGDYATNQFGANSQFWVSWRQRMDARYIAGYPAKDGRIANAKQVIIAQGDMPGATPGKPISGSACSEAEVVIVSSNPGSRPPFPTGYIECGRYAWFEQTLQAGKYAGNAMGRQVITRENMRRTDTGQYACINHPDMLDQSGCATYRPDEWITYMVHLQLGPDGRAVSSVSGKEQPGYIHSSFELYAAYQGEDFKLLHRQTEVVIPKGQHFAGGDPLQASSYRGGWGPADGHPQAKFGKLWLLPYMTNKDPNDTSPKSSTWFDEVIVSRCRIAAPGQPIPSECNPPDTTPPTPAPTASAALPQTGNNAARPAAGATAAPPPPAKAASGTKMQLVGILHNLPPGHWFEIPGSQLFNVLADACKVKAVRDAYEHVIPGLVGCNPENVMIYSGGAYDTRRHRLLAWGGGHSAYAGNELYGFDMREARWMRLSEPTPFAVGNSAASERKEGAPQSPSGHAANALTGPISVHSYDQIEYLPDQDWLIAAGGATYSANGFASAQTWLFDLKKEDATGWMETQPMPGKAFRLFEYNMSTAYDPVARKFIMRGYSEAGTFDPASQEWTITQKGLPTRKIGTVGELDPKRRVFVILGSGTAEIHQVGPKGELSQPQRLGASGDTDIEQCYSPGLVFDSKADRLTAWCSKGDVYTLDVDKRIWTRHPARSSVEPGDPATTPRIRGTFGRFRYMPEYNAYILANGVRSNVFLYRLSDDKGRIP
jgi:hypothetical protein